MKMKIALSRPDITEKEIEAVLAVIKTPYLSLGPKHKEFEESVAEYIGVKYAISVSSGTAGLHLVIRALDIKEGDEVITTPFSFVSSSNVMLFERARPVFVDIDPGTLNIDTQNIEELFASRYDFDGEVLRNRKTRAEVKAVLPVHVFGQPCDMDGIIQIAKKYNLKVVEDACEAIGAEYKGKKVGTFGEASVFAFYANKQITTAEGGMIVSNDERIAKLCKSMRNQGRDEGSDWLIHRRLGYNYRLNEMSAALGIAQMGRIKEILQARERVATIYNERLKDFKNIEIPYISSQTKMSWFVYVIRVGRKINRDKVMEHLQEKGIECRAYFPPIHLQPFYREMFGFKEGDFPITEKVCKSTIALPFYNNLLEMQIDYVCENLKEILEAMK